MVRIFGPLLVRPSPSRPKGFLSGTTLSKIAAAMTGM